MVSELEQLQAMRFQMLEYLYKKSSANIDYYISWRELCNDLGIEDGEIRKAYMYLVNEGLAEGKTLGTVGITHYGIKQYENAIKHPNEETQYFPPLNIIYVHHMENSQVQQGTTLSSQSVRLTQENKNEIEDFINSLKSHIEELGIKREDESEFNAELKTIEAQIKSERPKNTILKESILSIQKILEQAAGAVIAANLLKYIPPILEKLG